MSFPEAVRKLLQELSSIPYENLSKRVAFSRKGELESPSSFATNWLEDHRRHRLGGTCFALTHWLKTQLDALNLDSSYLLRSRTSGSKHLSTTLVSLVPLAHDALSGS